MKGKKFIPIVVAVVLISVSMFSGCIGRVVDTFGWDHKNEEGTTVRIWGQLALTENSENWNEGFVWDTEFHQDWQDYAYREWADNHVGLGYFSLTIGNLSRTTEYHYRAYGEYTKGASQYRFGADATFIPGGPRVDTINASGIGLTQVTLNGNLSHMGGAAFCTVYFLYGTDENALNKQTTSQNMTDTGLFSASLTALTTNETIYYKAVAENDADTWSGFVLKTTPGQPVVYSRQPGDIGKDHALLKAELVHMGGPATCTVWFIYGDVSPNQLDQSTAHQVMNATDPFQASIGNLSAGTTYWYRAIGDNGVAQGVGDIIEFATTPTAQTKTSGELADQYKPNKYTIDDELASRIPSQYLNLLQKYPILLKLLQQPRIRAFILGH
jgi:hypothetical protein